MAPKIINMVAIDAPSPAVRTATITEQETSPWIQANDFVSVDYYYTSIRLSGTGLIPLELLSRKSTACDVRCCCVV